MYLIFANDYDQHFQKVFIFGKKPYYLSGKVLPLRKSAFKVCQIWESENTLFVSSFLLTLVYRNMNSYTL